jgi:hypothetical protein
VAGGRTQGAAGNRCNTTSAFQGLQAAAQTVFEGERKMGFVLFRWEKNSCMMVQLGFGLKSIGSKDQAFSFWPPKLKARLMWG